MEESVDIKILSCTIGLVVDEPAVKAARFSMLELVNAFTAKFPMFEFDKVDGLNSDLFDDGELYLSMNLKLDGSATLKVVRKRAWKTNKSYRHLALEIMESEPDRWWTTGELTDEAIRRDYFDTDLLHRSQIQVGINTALMNTPGKYVYHESRQASIKRVCNCFKYRQPEGNENV